MSTYKNTTKILLLLTALLGQMIIAGCKKKPTEPVEQLRNPREYVWSIDTLSYPNSFQTFMYDIGGANTNNLYIVGHNDFGGGKMFEYDGRQWTDVKLSTAQGGHIAGAIDLRDIISFAPNDIWAVGDRLNFNPNPPPNFLDSSLVIHFNGTGWFEVKDPILLTGRFLVTLWGASSSNLWTGGVAATLFHYDGVKWQKLLPPVPSGAPLHVVVRSITGTSTGEIVFLLVSVVDLGKIPEYESFYF